MGIYMTAAMKRLHERTLETEMRMKATASGRRVDTQLPQWQLPDGRAEPLSRADRELVIRWQFLVGGNATIRDLGLTLPTEANDAMASAYLRLDEEIGPVCVIFGPEKNSLVFPDGDAHVLTKQEEVAIDRFLAAVETYRAEIRRSAQ